MPSNQEYLQIIDLMRADIEIEAQKRFLDIAFFKNQLNNISAEEERDRYRKALILLLYANFEGYVKIVLLIYLNFLNGLNVKNNIVKPALVASSLRNIFENYRNPNRKPNSYDSKDNLDSKMNDLVKRTEFIELFPKNLETVLVLDDTVVNTESNLHYIVLQKNLYSLGIPDDLFKEHESDINRLVNRRNSIAHGNTLKGVSEKEYEDLENIVKRMISNLGISIYRCAYEKLYLNNDNK